MRRLGDNQDICSCYKIDKPTGMTIQGNLVKGTNKKRKEKQETKGRGIELIFLDFDSSVSSSEIFASDKFLKCLIGAVALKN